MFSKESWLREHPEWTEVETIKKMIPNETMRNHIIQAKEKGFLVNEGFFEQFKDLPNYQNITTICKMSEDEIWKAMHDYKKRSKSSKELLADMINNMSVSGAKVEDIKKASLQMAALDPSIDINHLKMIYYAFPDTEENRLRIDGYIKHIYSPGLVPVLPHQLDVDETLFIRLNLLQVCDAISMHYDWKNDQLCNQLAEYAVSNDIDIIYNNEV